MELIQRVSEAELIKAAKHLAKQTRSNIVQTGLNVTDFNAVANHFNIRLEYGELRDGEDGTYSKDQRKIILNQKVTSIERVNFSFCHELMHDCIEHNDDLLCLFADAYIPADRHYEVMEKLCNAGAAELLLPTDNIREFVQTHGFLTENIPILCDLFQASSIAVAFQMVSTATHDCYLVIAEAQTAQQNADINKIPMFNMPIESRPQEKLIILYSSPSPAAKYSIKRHQLLPPNHFLYCSIDAVKPIKGDAKIPFASGKGWTVPCDALCFRSKVFAFFNVQPATSPSQLKLL